MSDNSTGRVREMVAEEVRVLLARRRLSASELARQIGVTQPYISRRLTGDTPFDVDDLERIADALDVPISDLMPAKVTDSRPKGGWARVTRTTPRTTRTAVASMGRDGRPLPDRLTGQSSEQPKMEITTAGGTARPTRLSQPSSGGGTR